MRLLLCCLMATLLLFFWGRPVGHDGVGVLTQGLDEGEDVVPAPAVEPRTVLPQLPQDLVHLEGCWQRLYQDGGLQKGTGRIEDLDLLASQCWQGSRTPDLRCGSVAVMT